MSSYILTLEDIKFVVFKVQIFKVQILKAQILKVQIFKVQIFKTVFWLRSKLGTGNPNHFFNISPPEEALSAVVHYVILDRHFASIY